jgi:hypothetical protein
MNQLKGDSLDEGRGLVRGPTGIMVLAQTDVINMMSMKGGIIHDS